MAAFIWLFTLVSVYLASFLIEPVKRPGVIFDRTVRVKEVEPTPAEKPQEAAPKVEPVKVAEETNPVDIDKGKAIYLTTCTKCHNKDPRVKGPIGPEIIDAPIEIMAYKVANGKYPKDLPAGFVPKRKTNQMIKQPQHIKDVPSIHAYIQSFKK
jgi:mono/diheme cytochrome c family protein